LSCMGRPRLFSREEVLEKALPLFWKRGYADTGLKDLEEATGVNKSGLYSEFKDKQDLYLSALRHYVATRRRDLLAQEPPGWGNIEAYLRSRAASKAGILGCFAVNTMREAELLPDEAHAIVNENRNALKAALRRNIEAEKTRVPAEVITEIIATFISGVAIEMNMKVGKPPLRKVEELMRVLRAL
jgi:TetR/AcrR family transcriptional regulator, copper-responsive repressor